MANGLQPRCSRNHVLTRWESIPCGGGHKHAVSLCRMRHGNKPCGEQIVMPPFGANCEKENR